MTVPKIPTRFALLTLTALLCVPIACAQPQYVRDTEKEDIDEAAMSTRFDRKDLDRLYEDNIDKLLSSRISKDWDRDASSDNPPVVAVFPMRNETSEHLQLDALLRKFETDLVNNTGVDMVSHEDQEDMISEVKRQQADSYDINRLAEYGKQLGAQYFVTGRVYDTAERVEGERRVQYYMFVQVIEVATSAIKFQNESNITKGLMK